MCDLQPAIALAPRRSFFFFYHTLLSYLSSSLSTALSVSLSLSPSVMNPYTFRWEASLCFSSTQTDSISCLGLLFTSALHIYHNLTNNVCSDVCVVFARVCGKPAHILGYLNNSQQMFPGVSFQRRVIHVKISFCWGLNASDRFAYYLFNLCDDALSSLR